MRDTQDEDHTFGRSLGTASCVLFVPAVAIFSISITHLIPQLRDTRTWFYDAAHGSIIYIALSAGIAAFGMLLSLASLGKCRDRQTRAILGIALNGPLFVAGLILTLAAIGAGLHLWPYGDR